MRKIFALVAGAAFVACSCRPVVRPGDDDVEGRSGGRGVRDQEGAGRQGRRSRRLRDGVREEGPAAWAS